MATIQTPEQLFTHKLGAALTMENTVLEMLGELERTAQRDELKQQFRHHADETRQQLQNLEETFSALGETPQEQPCPTIEGLQQESRQMIKQTDTRLVDAVLLSGAAETEHHEISVYEGLITHAKAMGQDDVVGLLEENLEQETHTLDEVKKATKQLASETAAQAA
jgi:ferritin-like metal-binding protein YciE